MTYILKKLDVCSGDYFYLDSFSSYAEASEEKARLMRVLGGVYAIEIEDWKILNLLKKVIDNQQLIYYNT